MNQIQHDPLLVPHPWGFAPSGSVKNSFTWPEFDFDLQEEAEESREKDVLLEYLHTRLVAKSSSLVRER